MPSPAVPLKLEPQDRLFRALLEQAKANFYTGEKTNFKLVFGNG